jgi:hypothetical protein
VTGHQQDLIRVAASQYGLIERTQVAGFDVSEDEIQGRLERGEWANPHPRVYVVGAAPASRLQQLLAACMAAGPDAVVSHRAAAWLWGFDGFPTAPIEITFRDGRGPVPAGVIRHRTQRFDPVDRTSWKGVPVTTRERTLLDLGAVVPSSLVETALESYLRTDGTVRKVYLRLLEIGGRGCRGVGVARALLENRGEGRPLGSALEVRYRRLCEANGLWPGVAQYEVILRSGRRIFIDRAYPEQKVAVELDGYADHTGRLAFRRDHERYVYLTRAGWSHLPFTFDDVATRPNYVIDSLRETLPLAVLLRSNRP